MRGAGGAFLEAPVSGSKGPAEQGQLIFLTAGAVAGCGGGGGGGTAAARGRRWRIPQQQENARLLTQFPSRPLPAPAAGDKQLFDAASPLLEVMGKASFFLGAWLGAPTVEKTSSAPTQLCPALAGSLAGFAPCCAPPGIPLPPPSLAHLSAGPLLLLQARWVRVLT